MESNGAWNILVDGAPKAAIGDFRAQINADHEDNGIEASNDQTTFKSGTFSYGLQFQDVTSTWYYWDSATNHDLNTFGWASSFAAPPSTTLLLRCSHIHEQLQSKGSTSAAIIFGSGLLFSVLGPVISAPVKAPPHTTKPIAPYTAPDNLAVPTAQLVSQTTMVNKAQSIATGVNGVVKSISLTTYGKHLSNVGSSVIDYSVSPNRQVYIIDISLPNGIVSHGGSFGPNAKIKYAFNAQTGKYLSSLTKGHRIGISPQAR